MQVCFSVLPSRESFSEHQVVSDELSSGENPAKPESQIEVIYLPISCSFPGGSRLSLEFNRIYRA